MVFPIKKNSEVFCTLSWDFSTFDKIWEKDGNTGYFDIEYYDTAQNAHEFLENSNSQSEIDIFFDALIKMMNIMHKTNIESNSEAIDLYIYEEIEQKIKDCYDNQTFKDFINHEEIIFNGKDKTFFKKVLDKYKDLCSKYYLKPKETFTHGNITLENLLYIPKDNKFIFIDPYEENIIDSNLAEFFATSPVFKRKI